MVAGDTAGTFAGVPDMISTFRGGGTDDTLPPVPNSAFNDGQPGPNECTFFHAALFEDV